MASRSGLSGFPVNPSTPINPSMNPMNSGHSSAMRMSAMPQNSPFRVMGSTPNQYHQVSLGTTLYMFFIVSFNSLLPNIGSVTALATMTM